MFLWFPIHRSCILLHRIAFFLPKIGDGAKCIFLHFMKERMSILITNSSLSGINLILWKAFSPPFVKGGWECSHGPAWVQNWQLEGHFLKIHLVSGRARVSKQVTLYICWDYPSTAQAQPFLPSFTSAGNHAHAEEIMNHFLHVFLTLSLSSGCFLFVFILAVLHCM